MMHTRLTAAYWGFMVRLVDAFCYIKATLQLHSCQKAHCDILCCLGYCLLISFCVDCLTCVTVYTHICSDVKYEFRMKYDTSDGLSGSNYFTKDPQIEITNASFHFNPCPLEIVFSCLMASLAVLLLLMQNDTHATMP